MAEVRWGLGGTCGSSGRGKVVNVGRRGRDESGMVGVAKVG